MNGARSCRTATFDDLDCQYALKLEGLIKEYLRLSAENAEIKKRYNALYDKYAHDVAELQQKNETLRRLLIEKNENNKTLSMLLKEQVCTQKREEKQPSETIKIIDVSPSKAPKQESPIVRKEPQTEGNIPPGMTIDAYIETLLPPIPLVDKTTDSFSTVREVLKTESHSSHVEQSHSPTPLPEVTSPMPEPQEQQLVPQTKIQKETRCLLPSFEAQESTSYSEEHVDVADVLNSALSSVYEAPMQSTHVGETRTRLTTDVDSVIAVLNRV